VGSRETRMEHCVHWLFPNGDWLRVFEVPVPVWKQLLTGGESGCKPGTKLRHRVVVAACRHPRDSAHPAQEGIVAYRVPLDADLDLISSTISIAAWAPSMSP